MALASNFSSARLRGRDSGKSVTMMSRMNITPSPPAEIVPALCVSPVTISRGSTIRCASFSAATSASSSSIRYVAQRST